MQEGCEWTGELRSLQDHLQTCDYVMVPCSNWCTIYSRKRAFSEEPQLPKRKVLEVYRKDLQKHLEECPQREYTCPHCEETDNHSYITGYHTSQCPKMEIKCSNAPLCKQVILREDEETHLSTCPYQKVPCKYKEFGCSVQPFLKDLQDHENDDKAHLRITMDTVLKTKAQCTSLTRECYRLQSLSTGQHATVPFTFKIDKFREKKLLSVFQSPPFFTHKKGYKLALEFEVSRNGGIDIECFLMKGKYDNRLEFPFKGTITVELLNQLEDDNHHSQTSATSLPSYGQDRVTDSNIGVFPLFILENFISYKNLAQSGSKNCQYLKDDCLVFRVHVEMHSYKPWLQCTYRV